MSWFCFNQTLGLLVSTKTRLMRRLVCCFVILFLNNQNNELLSLIYIFFLICSLFCTTYLFARHVIKMNIPPVSIWMGRVVLFIFKTKCLHIFRNIFCPTVFQSSNTTDCRSTLFVSVFEGERCIITSNLNSRPSIKKMEKSSFFVWHH